MTEQKFGRWVERYKRAWEKKDADLAASLFTGDIEYRETPFDEPAVGSEGVRRYWREATADQEDILFTYSNLLFQRDCGALQWECTYRRKGKNTQITVNGAMVLRFQGELASYFREWWHRHEA